MNVLTRWFLVVFLALSFTTMKAQESPSKVYDYSNAGKYTIAGVEIKGAENRDQNAIISITGLRVGKTIEIPGDDIPKAIKALWRLKLFENVEISQTKIEENNIYLQILITERPTLSRYTFKGVKKVQHEDLIDVLDGTLNKGSIVTEDIKALCIQKIQKFYIGKGFLNADVKITEESDELKENAVKLIFDINKDDRVKIASIDFFGNEKVKDKKLRKKMKNTKKKSALFKKSKYVKKDFLEDKKSIIAYYNTQGYRDAIITADSIFNNEDDELQIQIQVYEGEPYYFGDITWQGNTKYSDEQLSTILGISKGDIFNPEVLEKRLTFSLDGRDVSSLYLDDGYLFFNVDPVETSITDNKVNLKMALYEGAQATIDNVIIQGNDRTHEHVIRRELRTKPGDKFSRSNIIRSQREIVNLGYFNPETLDIQPQVNQAQGTVDVLYKVEERPSDQLELSAGYGGVSGLIGTLGVTFNNFSLRNIKDKSTWSPLPQGDGQKLSLRAQSNGQFFRSLNFSLTEPWLGGKKPNSFSVGAVYSSYDLEILGQGFLSILRGFVGLGTQLKWPDDFFSSSTTLTLENIVLDDYIGGNFAVFDNDTRLGVQITSGNFKNFSFRQIFQRSSINEPLYPRRGSRIALTAQFTLPYSLFRKDNYWVLDDNDRENILDSWYREFGTGRDPSTGELQALYLQEENARKFEWLEYHKWRIDAEWYYNIVDKLVFAFNAKMGYLGTYNDAIGITPFERFEVGGDGLSNQNVGITGKDIIALRGYDQSDLAQNNLGGGNVFNKFTMELRYPLSLNPSSTIYGLAFVQGGNSWGSFQDYNPFDLKRSVGFGARVFLPMFGLLGGDFGWGFDKETENYAKFSIVLGFEPD